uniref:Peptidase metallopeptidase domain-containing protein n=1 Tax=Manihot esculenta TaxID=3983 RepID=A0A2C9VKR0_MANES
MAPKFTHLLTTFLMLLFSMQLLLAQSRTLKSEGHHVGNTLKFLQSLKEVQKGQNIIGLTEVKKHLMKFGYYPSGDANNLTDDFDESLESALKTYQNFYQLEVTGNLDSATIKKMMIPRCGVPDITNHTSSSKPTSTSHKSKMFHMVSHYDFPVGFPDGHLLIQNPNEQDMRSACSQAFQRWESVSQFKFQEAPAGSHADIVIGFYRGDHGDEDPFDGPGNILAHSFPPQDGRFHYDADEDWSSNPNMNQMDLESVAVHEIGHLLGLAHSQDSNAIMYATIPPGTIKRELTQDDIDGIHALYDN